MSKVRAIVFHQHGTPWDVARLEPVEIPTLGPQQALIRMLAAPINPADLNVIEGKYPAGPELPGVPGVEGIGRVEHVGAEVKGVAVGARVLLPQFWVTRWYREASAGASDAMFSELFALAQSGTLHTPVERIYPLEEAAAALTHAARGGRSGKILFGAPEVVAQFAPP